VGYWRVFGKHVYFCVGWWAALDWVGVDSDGYGETVDGIGVD
jgi:hypothetical protein